MKLYSFNRYMITFKKSNNFYIKYYFTEYNLSKNTKLQSSDVCVVRYGQ